LIKEDEKLRAVSTEEMRQFAQDNDLMFHGESSALSDTNIKEVVEALMESKVIFDNFRCRDSQCSGPT
jgi:hypothetical protein